MDSDTQLFLDVSAELVNSLDLDYARLSIQAQAGIVTIAGRVDTYDARRTLERAAKRVPGIKQLILEIGIAPICLDASRDEIG